VGDDDEFSVFADLHAWSKALGDVAVVTAFAWPSDVGGFEVLCAGEVVGPEEAQVLDRPFTQGSIVVCDPSGFPVGTLPLLDGVMQMTPLPEAPASFLLSDSVQASFPSLMGAHVWAPVLEAALQLSPEPSVLVIPLWFGPPGLVGEAVGAVVVDSVVAGSFAGANPGVLAAWVGRTEAPLWDSDFVDAAADGLSCSPVGGLPTGELRDRFQDILLTVRSRWDHGVDALDAASKAAADLARLVEIDGLPAESVLQQVRRLTKEAKDEMDATFAWDPEPLSAPARVVTTVRNELLGGHTTGSVPG